MKMMVANGVLEGQKSIDMGFCEGCVMEKYKRVSFTNAAKEPKKTRLEMVHTDVWGPSLVSSFLVPKFYWLDDSHSTATTLCFPKASEISHDHSFPPRHYNFDLVLSYIVNIHSLMYEDIL